MRTSTLLADGCIVRMTMAGRPLCVVLCGPSTAKGSSAAPAAIVSSASSSAVRVTAVIAELYRVGVVSSVIHSSACEAGHTRSQRLPGTYARFVTT